jgi:uncharacterized membrane protein
MAENLRLVRRWHLAFVAALAASAAPLLVLVVPAVLHLSAVEPLLHESELFPGFSRDALVAVPLAALAIVNVAIVIATHSIRRALAAIAITTAIAVFLVLGAAAFVESLNDLGGGVD